MVPGQDIDELLSKNQLRVLHDFDSPYPSYKYALKRMFQLLLYWLSASRKFRFLRDFKFVQNCYRENYDYCLLLAHLDRLLGVKAKWGIHVEVQKVFPDLKSRIESLGFQVHDHWHVPVSDGVAPKWNPPLDIPREYYWWDQDYVKGKVRPKPGGWIVFHGDYPEFLLYYLRCLNELPNLHELQE